MKKNKSKTETKGSTEGRIEPKVGQEWDSRFGAWASLDDKDNIELPSYSRLLFKEHSVFIIREFRLCNTETDGNRYLIKDHLANNFFYGIERNGCPNKLCVCGAKRAFTLTFYDKNRAPALHLCRPFRINCCGLIPCCRQVCFQPISFQIHFKSVFNRKLR